MFLLTTYLSKTVSRDKKHCDNWEEIIISAVLIKVMKFPIKSEPKLHVTLKATRALSQQETRKSREKSGPLSDIIRPGRDYDLETFFVPKWIKPCFFLIRWKSPALYLVIKMDCGRFVTCYAMSSFINMLSYFLSIDTLSRSCKRISCMENFSWRRGNKRSLEI